MTPTNLTLQNRISSLMIISSVLFVSVFTFIQLNIQINSINRYNSYQANLSSVIVKYNLEGILKKFSPPDYASYMQSALNSLKESDIIKDVLVFDKEGTIWASTQEGTVGKNARYKDLDKFQDLEYVAQENKWFISTTDQIFRQLYIYVALRVSPQEPILYVAKISFSLGNIQDALFEVYKPVIITIIIIIALNIILGYLLSRTVIGPIKMLNEVTKLIAAGDLSIRTNILSNDELQELGLTFNYMTEELIKMKERAENANPLTKLPGNIVIREEVEKRIRENKLFMVIYADLDNFKAFNDGYGIAKGDEAIKLASEIFKEAVKTKGTTEDFVGHEGGDDFILMTSPEKAQEVADFITQEFDKRIRSLYNQEDLDRGHIVAQARDGTIKQFAIMTISLAGVTNGHRKITTYAEVTNIAAEIKKKAKSVGSSVFVIDKRSVPRTL